jgi:hypothetical protein
MELHRATIYTTEMSKQLTKSDVRNAVHMYCRGRIQCHVFCYRVVLFVLCSQRGSSRVYLHDVSVMQLR